MINTKMTSVVEEGGGTMGASLLTCQLFSAKMAGTLVSVCLSLASLGSLQCARLLGNNIEQKENISR